MADECRSCRAPVDFAAGPPSKDHPEGSTAPLDHVAGPGGALCALAAGTGEACTHPPANLAAWRDGPVLRFRYLKIAQPGACLCHPAVTAGLPAPEYCTTHTGHAGPGLAPGEHYARTHYASCPNAGEWRKRGRGRAAVPGEGKPA